tara:strand:+ start:520 stop:1080 length:561 start_codon:yes stop_codon:yes gene_type:complete
MIQDFFPTPVYSEYLNLDVKDIAQYCLEMKSNTKSVQISNVGGWQSPGLTGEHLLLNNLFKSILDAAEIYRDAIDYKHPLSIKNIWININGYKDYNIEHIHTTVASGVFYVKAQSGDLVLKHPARDLIDQNWMSSDLQTYTSYNSAVWRIPPEPNMLIIFPGWLSHRVESNLDKEDRISISFNLGR